MIGRRRRIGILVLLGLAAAVGHVAFWYLPRARPDTVPVGGPAAEILAEPSLPLALWIAWPHQNLAWLEGRAGLDPATWEAAARLAGVRTDLPSFGALSVAPASELVVARGDRRRWALRARVYPTVAAFARLSGALAGNPWLSGGDVRVEGDSGRVDWSGRWWQVAVGRPPGTGGRVEPDGPVLALLRVGGGADPLPPGVFGLHRVEDGLEIRPERVAAPPLPEVPVPSPGEPDRILLVLGDPEPIGGPRQAMALYAVADDSANDLPPAVRLRRGASEAWPLPGAELLELAGRELERDRARGWEIVSTGSEALGAGRGLVSRLGGPDGAVDPRLEWAAWIELPAAHREVARVSRIVDQLPFFGRRTRERWHDATQVLASLSTRFDRLVLAVGRDPDSLFVQLQERRVAAADGD